MESRIRSYSFGFNGQEKLNEAYGEGNAYDFGARVYDPRIGRFLSIDPLYRQFPFVTPYCYAGNIPIAFADEFGKGPIIRWCTSSVTNADGSTAIHVSIEVEINIAVINKSSVALTKSEGYNIAKSLESNATRGDYDGAVTDQSFAQGVASYFGVSSNTNVTVTYEVKLVQNFRFVENASEIKDHEDILVLVDSHEPTPDQSVGGLAHYDYGVATANIESVAPNPIYVQSLGRHLGKRNTGNHEVGHLLGIKDRYRYIEGEKVKDDPNSLMGASNSLKMMSYDIAEIVWNAVMEIKNYNQNKKERLPTSYKLTNRDGGSYLPKYSGTVEDRIDYAIDKSDDGGK